MTKRTSPAAATPSFEDALAELEKLVAAMEGQSLPLEQSVAAYQRGSELIRICQQHLESAREKLQVLDNTDDTAAPRPLDLSR